MPAYKSYVKPKECEAHRCMNKGRYEVFNSEHELLGRYCAKCADRKVKVINDAVKED